jgi:hypothetical protein
MEDRPCLPEAYGRVGFFRSVVLVSVQIPGFDMKSENKSVLYTILVVVLGGVIFAGAKQITSGGIAGTQRLLNPTSNLEGMLDRALYKEPFFTALAEHFPTEWTIMREGMASDIRANRSMPDIMTRAHARTREFMLERASATASAPTDSLFRLLNAEFHFISQLQRENVGYCADFGTRGLPPETQLSPSMLEKFNVAAVARVIATRQGLDHPERRNVNTDDDWALLIRNMRANGVPESALDALQNPASSSPESVCEGTVHLFRALSDLNPIQGAKLYGEMIRDSAKTGS